MWLWLAELGDIEFLELLVSLDEALLGLLFVFGLLVRVLLASIFHPAKRDLGDRVIMLSNCNGSALHHEVLELVLWLCEANILCRVQIGTDAHWLSLLRNGNCPVGLVDESDRLRVVLVKDTHECPYEPELGLVKDLEKPGVRIFDRDIVKAGNWSSLLEGLLPGKTSIAGVLLRVAFPCFVDLALLRLLECTHHFLELLFLIFSEVLEAASVSRVITPYLDDSCEAHFLKLLFDLL